MWTVVFLLELLETRVLHSPSTCTRARANTPPRLGCATGRSKQCYATPHNHAVRLRSPADILQPARKTLPLVDCALGQPGDVCVRAHSSLRQIGPCSWPSLISECSATVISLAFPVAPCAPRVNLFTAWCTFQSNSCGALHVFAIVYSVYSSFRIDYCLGFRFGGSRPRSSWSQEKKHCPRSVVHGSSEPIPSTVKHRINMASIDQIPELRAVLTDLQTQIGKCRDDANTSFLDVNKRLVTIDEKIGDTADRARANLKSIDELTTKIQKDLQDFRS